VEVAKINFFRSFRDALARRKDLKGRQQRHISFQLGICSYELYWALKGPFNRNKRLRTSWQTGRRQDKHITIPSLDSRLDWQH